MSGPNARLIVVIAVFLAWLLVWLMPARVTSIRARRHTNGLAATLNGRLHNEDCSIACSGSSIAHGCCSGSEYRHCEVSGRQPRYCRWVIIHSQNGLGIQLQPGMPATSQFSTNIVMNAPRDGVGAPQSAQLSIVGDCQAKTVEIMSLQPYQGKYRTGSPVGGPTDPDGVVRHVEPNGPMDWVFAAVCMQ